MTAETPSRSTDTPRETSSPPRRTGQEATPPDVGEPLSEDEKMLLALRDELYEGRWDLFERDLEARLNGEPHVFEIGPVSDRLRDTIESHLRIIKALRDRKI